MRGIVEYKVEQHAATWCNVAVQDGVGWGCSYSRRNVIILLGRVQVQPHGFGDYLHFRKVKSAIYVAMVVSKILILLETFLVSVTLSCAGRGVRSLKVAPQLVRL